MEDLSFHQIKQGDKKVFEKLFHQYYGSLCRFACTYLKDMSHAEDLVQETFVKLWEKKASINIESSLKAYLFQAVKNACLNALKHEKVKAEHQQFQIHQAETESTESSIEANELHREIYEKLEALPEKRKAIFKLSREEGLKYSEIAEKLNISIKTVENQMGLALKYLRQHLKHLNLFVLFLWNEFNKFL